jgi:hypothetical protein
MAAAIEQSRNIYHNPRMGESSHHAYGKYTASWGPNKRLARTSTNPSVQPSMKVRGRRSYQNSISRAPTAR